MVPPWFQKMLSTLPHLCGEEAKGATWTLSCTGGTIVENIKASPILYNRGLKDYRNVGLKKVLGSPAVMQGMQDLCPKQFGSLHFVQFECVSFNESAVWGAVKKIKQPS